MAKVTVKLLRPLNGQEAGSQAEYDKADAERLAGYGAVEIVEGAVEQTAAEPAEEAPAASEAKAKGAAPARKAASGRKAKAK